MEELYLKQIKLRGFKNFSKETNVDLQKKINIVFYLFDQDGEPANECRSNISIEFELSIMPQEESRFCLSLDSFMNAIPETPLFIDYLYLAKIEYEDGSVWEDPFGLMAFK